MNWLDILTLIIITLFTLLGIKRGFIKGTFSIIAIIIGLVAGIMFYTQAAGVLKGYGLVRNVSIASVIGFLVITVASYLLIQIFAWALTKFLSTLHLSLLDRIMGGFLGIITGVILVSFIISGISFFFPENEPPLRNSVFVPYVNGTFAIIKEVIPEDFKKDLQLTRKIIQKEGMKAILKIKETERLQEIIKKEDVKPQKRDK
ncbi:MAG: CvpA family protein [Thermodesulfobacteriota bacterium]